MPTVKIVNKLEAQKIDVNGTIIELNRQSVTEVDAIHWFELRDRWKSQIKDRHIYPESETQEQDAISTLKKEWFAKFDALGTQVIEPATKHGGEYSQGAALRLASEWLIYKSEARESEALAVSVEANSIAREANKIAQSSQRAAANANRIARFALVVAAVAAIGTVVQAVIAVTTAAPGSTAASGVAAENSTSPKRQATSK